MSAPLVRRSDEGAPRAGSSRIAAQLARVSLAVGLAGLILAAVGDDGPIRAAATLAFLVTGPGAALNRWLRLDEWTAVLLAPPVSLAIAAAAAGTTFYLGLWAPGLLYVALLAATALLVALDAGWRPPRNT